MNPRQSERERRRIFPVRTTRSSEKAPDREWVQTPGGFVSLAEYREARG